VQLVVVTRLDGSSETWRRLQRVPLLLAIQTSKPRSARMNGSDSSGDASSHDMPSCHASTRPRVTTSHDLLFSLLS